MKLAPLILGLAMISASGFLPRADPSAWNAVLKHNVSPQHRVGYAQIKKNGSKQLDAYLAELARPGAQPLTPAEEKALLIDAYNAFTVSWIVQNYPTPSIWKTREPFKTERFDLGGQNVSLNEIESRLRKMGDPRIHAALVCAARSCPPLRREAYTADKLNQQLDANAREWLANPVLNHFDPEKHQADLSPIFKWYKQDFDSYPGGLKGFLGKYAPPGAQKEVGAGSFTISYMNYDWGLNDQSNLGSQYSRLRLGWDWLINQIRAWFAELGTKYHVNPFVFGCIYFGAIPFFGLSVAWIIRNLRRKKSVVAPTLSASFFFISAYLYLLIEGRNIPAWVYAFVLVMTAFGTYSTLLKIRRQSRKTSGQ